MAKTFRTIDFDQDTINREINTGRTNPKDLGKQVDKLIDELKRQGRDAAKGPDAPRGYPEGILVSGKDEGDIKDGYRKATRGTPFSDYTMPVGKVYS